MHKIWSFWGVYIFDNFFALQAYIALTLNGRYFVLPKKKAEGTINWKPEGMRKEIVMLEWHYLN
jgi:hypothetical protein